MKVKEIRQKVMLTQKEFANVLNISLAVVQNWEQGKNEPSLRYKRKLVEFCKANGIEVWGTEKCKLVYLMEIKNLK